MTGAAASVVIQKFVDYFCTRYVPFVTPLPHMWERGYGCPNV
jgi:hypothetical protein